MMIRRILSAVLILSFFISSCTKDDVVTAENSADNEDANISEEETASVVYNVNKTVMLELINAVRKTGCNCGSTEMPAVSALTWDDQLAKAAYDHSADMKTNNYFNHTGLNGSTPGDRIKAAGYNWKTYGENIANGYTSEQSVVNGWLNSEGHCKNIMDADFKHIGVGRDGNYWTQVFGAK